MLNQNTHPHQGQIPVPVHGKCLLFIPRYNIYSGNCTEWLRKKKKKKSSISMVHKSVQRVRFHTCVLTSAQLEPFWRKLAVSPMLWTLRFNTSTWWCPLEKTPSLMPFCFILWGLLLYIYSPTSSLGTPRQYNTILQIVWFFIKTEVVCLDRRHERIEIKQYIGILTPQGPFCCQLPFLS